MKIYEETLADSLATNWQIIEYIIDIAREMQEYKGSCDYPWDSLCQKIWGDPTPAQVEIIKSKLEPGVYDWGGFSFVV